MKHKLDLQTVKMCITHIDFVRTCLLSLNKTRFRNASMSQLYSSTLLDVKGQCHYIKNRLQYLVGTLEEEIDRRES